MYGKRSFFLRAQERQISDQNGAGEPHDYDSTLYNDTSLKEMGLKELVEHQCGIPNTGTKYLIKETALTGFLPINAYLRENRWVMMGRFSLSESARGAW